MIVNHNGYILCPSPLFFWTVFSHATDCNYSIDAVREREREGEVKGDESVDEKKRDLSIINDVVVSLRKRRNGRSERRKWIEDERDN